MYTQKQLFEGIFTFLLSALLHTYFKVPYPLGCSVTAVQVLQLRVRKFCLFPLPQRPYPHSTSPYTAFWYIHCKEYMCVLFSVVSSSRW